MLRTNVWYCYFGNWWMIQLADKNQNLRKMEWERLGTREDLCGIVPSSTVTADKIDDAGSSSISISPVSSDISYTTRGSV